MKYITYLLCLFLFVQLSFYVLPRSAHAQDTVDISYPASSAGDLTYPGLLPDHPFYFLKVARDNFMGFFKGEPIDKASFALLQSEKHISATLFMITQKRDADLAYVSLDNGQNYLEEAVRQIESAKQQGTDTQELHQKIKGVSKKHLVVLSQLSQQEGNESKQLAKANKRAEKISDLIANLHP